MRRSHALEWLLVLSVVLALSLEGFPSSADPPAHNVWIVGRLPVDGETLQDDLKRLRGLDFSRVVPAENIDRPRLRQLFEKSMEETTQAELDAEEATLRVLGLVPDQFDLKPFWIKFHTGETAGVYVHKVKRFYVVADTRHQRLG